jgi:hypothetical protein
MNDSSTGHDEVTPTMDKAVRVTIPRTLDKNRTNVLLSYQ